MEDSCEIIRKNIRYLRSGAGMTQEKLAFASKLTTACVSRLERNCGNPTVRTLDQVSEALKVHTIRLFEEELSQKCGEVQLEQCLRDARLLPVDRQLELVRLIRTYLSVERRL